MQVDNLTQEDATIRTREINVLEFGAMGDGSTGLLIAARLRRRVNTSYGWSSAVKRQRPLRLASAGLFTRNYGKRLRNIIL